MWKQTCTYSLLYFRSTPSVLTHLFWHNRYLAYPTFFKYFCMTSVQYFQDNKILVQYWQQPATSIYLHPSHTCNLSSHIVQQIWIPNIHPATKVVSQLNTYFSIVWVSLKSKQNTSHSGLMKGISSSLS